MFPVVRDLDDVDESMNKHVVDVVDFFSEKRRSDDDDDRLLRRSRDDYDAVKREREAEPAPLREVDCDDVNVSSKIFLHLFF